MPDEVLIQYQLDGEWKFAHGDVDIDDEGPYLRIEEALDLGERVQWNQRLRASEIDVFRPDGPHSPVCILADDPPTVAALLIGWRVSVDGVLHAQPYGAPFRH